MKNKALLWIIAVLITITAAYYQKTTGPTYPKKTKVELNDIKHKFKLPRTNGESDCEVVLKIPDTNITASIFFRKFPTNDKWSELIMKRDGEKLITYLPQQDPAGKLSYYIVFNTPKSVAVFKEDPIRIRFKGDVPIYILLPHVLFMFAAMLLSNMSGIMALGGINKYRFYGLLTFITFLIGGMILGPFVQKFAFGEFWTGIPFGWDLTDNKTLISFLFWVLAIGMNIKKERPVFIIIASAVMLIIFTIPHSMFGSELDPNTGKVIQGMIQIFHF